MLFFTKDIPWQLVDFRETLKYNQEISMAYNAIPQRTEWKPHLTLGYPETPAKPDDWDPMGTQYVSFDKIAVWYGDSEGSEFLLTPNPKPSGMDSPSIAAWADAVGNALAHHGIKGMKWGVRKSPEKQDAAWQKKNLGISTRKQKRGKFQPKIDKVVIAKANRVYKGKAKEINKRWTRKDRKANKAQYEKEHYDAWTKELKKVTDALPPSPSGKLQFEFRHTPDHWGIYVKDVKHADDHLLFTPVRNADGEIIDVKESAMAQGEDTVSDILAHHGIKGMKWGVRRSKQELAVSDDAATAAAAKTKAKEQGPQALSNKEMRDLVTRMQLEQQLKNVTPATRTQKGAKFAANLLVNTGKQQAQMVVNDQVNKQIKKALGG